MTSSAPGREPWQKSTFSGSDEGSCVEVAIVEARAE
ncbi:DUF397 domain-containing protein [Actinoallomurus sp. CA-150999]